jgi:hypothetical protein
VRAAKLLHVNFPTCPLSMQRSVKGHVYRTSKCSFKEIFQEVKEMTVKSTLSAVALLAGLTLSGSAFAQSMLGDIDISTSGDAAQAYCDTLALDDTNSDTAGENPNSEDNLDSDQDRDDGTTEPDTDAAAESTDTPDFSTVTLDDCREAGLIQ